MYICQRSTCGPLKARGDGLGGRSLGELVQVGFSLTHAADAEPLRIGRRLHPAMADEPQVDERLVKWRGWIRVMAVLCYVVVVLFAVMLNTTD